jgi:hypothetical protein
MLRVVVDTNVYISAIFWGGKPRHVIDLGRDGKIQIFTSEDIEQEILDKLMTKFGLNSDDAGRVMADFSTFTKPQVDRYFLAYPMTARSWELMIPIGSEVRSRMSQTDAIPVLMFT